MSRTAPTDDLRGYLLGTLSEEDSEELEQSLLSDDALHELLLATEEELIDETIRGALSGEESGSFLSYLARLPGGRERLEFARELQGALALPAAAPERGGSLRHWRSLLLTLARPRVPIWTAAALLLLCAGALWFREARVRESASGVAPERAAGPSSVPPAPHVLTAGRLRGSSELQQVVLAPETTLLELMLDLGFDAYPSYRAELHDADSRELFAASQLQAVSGPDQILVTLRVPADRLAAGDYYVLLEGVDASGAPENVARYDFRLVSNER